MKAKVAYKELADGRLTVTYSFICARAPRAMNAEDYEGWEASAGSSELETPTEGEEYMVAISEYVGPNGDKNPRLVLLADNGEGFGGNSDHTIKSYHGWRGTTDDWAFYAKGLRRCLSVTVAGKRSRKVRVVFGKDRAKEEA